MGVKETLKQMQVGERRDFSSNPCYPVWVEKMGQDAFHFADSLCSLADAVKRLRPFGSELF